MEPGLPADLRSHPGSMKRRILGSISRLGIVVILALVFSLHSPSGHSDAKTVISTIVPSQTITTNTIWTLAGSPYIVQGQIIVAQGAIFAVQPER